MRYLALAMSIVGAILIAAGAVCFCITTAMTAGIYALFSCGGISLALGLIFFISDSISERNRSYRRT